MNDNTIIDTNDKPYIEGETMELKIGSTTYIITGKYPKDGKPKLVDKLWRLIENDEN